MFYELKMVHKLCTQMSYIISNPLVLVFLENLL